jgi:hypothetical protein
MHLAHRYTPTVTDSDSVKVARSGDGQSHVTFTVAFMRTGARPKLRIVDATRLRRLVFNGTAGGGGWSTATASDDVLVSVSTAVPGGIDLHPIPGRYLTSATHTPSVTVRIGGASTAKCAAPWWVDHLVGCFAEDDVYSEVVLLGFYNGARNVEECVRHCGRHGHVDGTGAAVAMRGEACKCLATAPTTSTAYKPYTCHVPCASNPEQTCGGHGHVIKDHVNKFSVYSNP